MLAKKRYRCYSISLIALILLSTLLIPRREEGIFAKFEAAAEQKLAEMTLDEKISQILLVRYPEDQGIETLQQYQFGGYVFFGKDFIGKSTADVQNEMHTLQSVAKIPILTAVDEEGGSVVRISNNSQLAPARYRSPQELYEEGGFPAIAKDTREKSALLKSLGINLNLAPVVDVSTDPGNYMFARSLGQDTALTSQYARTVIEAAKNTGVSYTLKHFPGYGNNLDTHKTTSVDQRTYDKILTNDLPPFRAGIQAGAEAILVSHNIVTSIDSVHPASLSLQVHQLLTQNLKFTGVIITDDISMAALDGLENTTLQAALAGNDLIITTDYERSIAELRTALDNGEFDETLLDQKVTKILAWKYYKGLLAE